MRFDVELCDLQQNVLTRLDRRKPGAYVELGLNAMRRGFCPLALDDEAREVAAALSTVLRITLKDDDLPGGSLPLFIGRVVIPEDDVSAELQQLGLSAADPFFQLERELIREVAGSTWNAVAFAGTDQSQIMWSLIDAQAGHGVIEGDLPESVDRDRTYPPSKELGPALTEMSEVIGGPDFELEPVIAADGTLARFNTFYPRQGEDKSESVIFVVRGKPEDALTFKHAPGGEEVCNRFVAIGAPLDNEGEGSPFASHPAYVAEHAGSIAEYENAFERREQLDDVKETATLEDHAKATVAGNAFPIPYFEFTAAPERYAGETGEGIPPRFGIDYWIGDTIACHAYLGEPGDDPLELTGRVTDAKVVEMASGQLAVQLSCSPEVSSSGVTGEAITLRVPQGEEE